MLLQVVASHAGNIGTLWVFLLPEAHTCRENGKMRQKIQAWVLEHRIHLSIALPLVVLLTIFWFLGADERAKLQVQHEELAKMEALQKVRSELKQKLGPALLHNQFPAEAEISLEDRSSHLKVEYTLDADLQREATHLLKSYHPDYGAIFIMDATTGAVRAMVSYQKDTADSDAAENLALRGTYPAASIFKIVTATAALDRYKLSPDTLVMFKGGNHTLYKRNVLFSHPDRWSREMTLREAFARSINSVFGRLTLERMQPKDIQDYAVRFGFNQPIQTDLPIDPGFTQIPQEKSFALAEIVSGYNRITRMSPAQGAMIAGSVANGGVMRVPFVVQALRDQQNNIVWKPESVTAGVTMTGEGAERLKDLMEATIRQGTSRKTFRSLVRDRKFKELELGGKTGSLLGDNPKGKVDWFVGYAIGGPDDKLAIGAITVNKEYWTVKSSFLAQSLFKRHFKDQFSNKNRDFFNAGLGQ